MNHPDPEHDFAAFKAGCHCCGVCCHARHVRPGRGTATDRVARGADLHRLRHARLASRQLLRNRRKPAARVHTHGRPGVHRRLLVQRRRRPANRCHLPRATLPAHAGVPLPRPARMAGAGPGDPRLLRVVVQHLTRRLRRRLHMRVRMAGVRPAAPDAHHRRLMLHVLRRTALDVG